MFSLKLENEYNNSIELTGNEDKFQVTNITGLNPPNAIISTSTNYNFDGVRYNSSRLDKRNIVITLVIQDSVEQNRMLLNSVVFPKRYIKTYYKNNSKDLYIEGYVESLEYDIFSEKCVSQISIICTNPYFVAKDITTNTLSSVVNLFEFPFSTTSQGIPISEYIGVMSKDIINYGNAESGVLIELEARNTVVRPSLLNLTTMESMTIDTELNAGDRILINSFKGEKYIRKDCNCVQSNLINSLEQGSKWIKLVSGSNRLSYSAMYGAENLDVIFKHHDLFGGV